MLGKQLENGRIIAKPACIHLRNQVRPVGNDVAESFPRVGKILLKILRGMPTPFLHERLALRAKIGKCRCGALHHGGLGLGRFRLHAGIGVIRPAILTP